MLLQNFTTVFLIIGLNLILISNKNFDKKTNIIFSLLSVIIITLLAEEILDLYFSKFHSPSFWRYVISAIGYVFRPCVIALLITISLRRSKINIILWIPNIILAVIAFTDYFTHIMFWYSEDNEFLRGPFTYFAHIVSALYLIVFLLMDVKRRKTITFTENLTILFSSFICLLATILETLLQNTMFLITDAMAVSIALYYIVLYAETFRIDVLTGLLNRRSLYSNIKKKTNKTFTVISVDLNCLKEINDTYGHSAGDQALKNLATILLQESLNDYIPYRIGGDEFILIGKKQPETEINLFFNRIRSKLEDKNIMASFGWALYRPGDSFNDVCNEADKLMYKDKRNYRNRTKT